MKGTLQEFAKRLFGEDTKVKFRPHHFQFTEPSAEMDVTCFKYVRNHHDEILALQLIHNGRAGELSSDDLQDLNQKLSEALLFFNVVRQWNDYALLRPKSVRKLSGGEETEALTNLIQLVRFAYGQIEELCSLPSLAAQRFELWCGQKQNELPLTPEQKELFRIRRQIHCGQRRLHIPISEDA